MIDIATPEQPFAILGVGGIGVVLCEVLMANGMELVAAFDDRRAGQHHLNIKIESPSEIKALADNVPLVICLGNNAARRELSETFGRRSIRAIHPSAIISPSADIGPATMIFHGSVVQYGASIGSHCIINTRASIDHDCVIGDYVHIAPNTTLCGLVRVGDGAEVGAGAVLLPSVRVGVGARVGAGAVVTRDVKPNDTVVGVPARPLP